MTIPPNAATRFAAKINELDAKWCAGCLRPAHLDAVCDKRSTKMLESIKTVIEKNCPEMNKFQCVWALHSLDNSCTTDYIVGRLNSGQQSGKKGKRDRVSDAESKD
jgi:hypothetical protein